MAGIRLPTPPAPLQTSQQQRQHERRQREQANAQTHCSIAHLAYVLRVEATTRQQIANAAQLLRERERMLSFRLISHTQSRPLTSALNPSRLRVRTSV